MRLVTVIASPQRVYEDGVWVSTIYPTNSYAVSEGEAARVVQITPYSQTYGTDDGLFWFVKSGQRVEQIFRGDVIQGPVTFYLKPGDPSMLTLELLPAAFDPGKALIVPQGSNAVAVAMEWSTNLVHWSDATNGVYGTADAAKFFRVKASPALP